MQRWLVCLFLVLVLSSCAQQTASTPTPAAILPYQTLPPTQTFTLLPPLTGNSLPTPTIIIYMVVQGDTLNRIAQRYGISLEALLAANPGISPTVLSVGTKLVIPGGTQTPVEPTPTPAPLPVRQARCWPETDGGLWCFALLQNDLGGTLENLSARFTLLDTNGQEIVSQEAYGLLDILPAAASVPLAAHFPPPVQPDAPLRVQVLTAFRLLTGDVRYLPVSLENTLVSVAASGRTADLSGRVLLPGAGTANTLWVLASAYDQAGNVVGLRRWESPAPLTSASPVSFHFMVSSMGPAITRVEFLSEARP
jgi:hypothetical protein